MAERISAEEYFKEEVIKSASSAKSALKNVGDLTKSLVKAEMHQLNDYLHKSKFPITHMHLKKSINGGGTIKHASTSKAAGAIMKSKEFVNLTARYENSSFKDRLLFTSNRDLARAFYEATVMGEVSADGKGVTFSGTLVDVFDFRLSGIPKDLTLRGAKLRLAGNIAYVAQEMGLLRPVKLSVDLAGAVK